MGAKRDYGQFCGLAAGLNIVGERWTLLIIRELLISPIRFNDIMENLPGIGPNLLSERLRMLTEHGVVEQLPVTGDGRGKLYQLTALGRQLSTPLLSLAHWGMQFLSENNSKGAVRAEWGFLAVQAMVRDDRIPAVDETYQFDVGEDTFVIEVRDGAVRYERRSAAEPDLTITSDPDTFIRIGARMLSPFEAIASGRVKVEGSPEAIHRCTHMLGLG